MFWSSVHIKGKATTEERFIRCLCSAWHQEEQTSLPLFGREKRWSKKKREMQVGGAGVWQVRLHLLSNGYIVMARLLPLVLSDTRTCSHKHTNLWQRLDQSFLLPLKLLPNPCLSHVHTALLLHPPLPPFSSLRQRWDHVRLTIRLELGACIRLACAHTRDTHWRTWWVAYTSHGSQTMSLADIHLHHIYLLADWKNEVAPVVWEIFSSHFLFTMHLHFL